MLATEDDSDDQLTIESVSLYMIHEKKNLENANHTHTPCSEPLHSSLSGTVPLLPVSIMQVSPSKTKYKARVKRPKLATQPSAAVQVQADGLVNAFAPTASQDQQQVTATAPAAPAHVVPGSPRRASNSLISSPNSAAKRPKKPEMPIAGLPTFVNNPFTQSPRMTPMGLSTALGSASSQHAAEVASGNSRGGGDDKPAPPGTIVSQTTGRVVYNAAMMSRFLALSDLV